MNILKLSFLAIEIRPNSYGCTLTWKECDKKNNDGPYRRCMYDKS